MSLITLNLILCIRNSRKKKGKCCFNCILPATVLQQMGTVEKYTKSLDSRDAQLSISASLN